MAAPSRPKVVDPDVPVAVQIESTAIEMLIRLTERLAAMELQLRDLRDLVELGRSAAAPPPTLEQLEQHLVEQTRGLPAIGVHVAALLGTSGLWLGRVLEHVGGRARVDCGKRGGIHLVDAAHLTPVPEHWGGP